MHRRGAFRVPRFTLERAISRVFHRTHAAKVAKLGRKKDRA
jgi:hypothetical protein